MAEARPPLPSKNLSCKDNVCTIVSGNSREGAQWQIPLLENDLQLLSNVGGCMVVGKLLHLEKVAVQAERQ